MPGKIAKVRSKLRPLIMVILVMVFVLGSGLLIYDKFFKTSKISGTQTTTDPGIPGWWYEKYFGQSICDFDECRPEADPDADKLNNSQEYYYKTDPLNFRTAGDELNDGELVAAGIDPSQPGRMSFEESASDENIIGESLVFDSDIKKLVAESSDISKVNLPLVADDELTILYDIQSEDVYMEYFEELRTKTNRYFSQTEIAEITAILQDGYGSDVSMIQIKAKKLSVELKTVAVPELMVNFHKYNIAFYQLLADVIGTPSPNNINQWYDKAQAFLAVQQKMSLEKQLLSKQFGE